MKVPSGFGSGMDGNANFLEGATATNVGDGRIDVGIGWLGFSFEKGCGRHDHSRLAIAALRHLMLEPGLLHLGKLAIFFQAFDGLHFLFANCTDRINTRALGLAIDQHRAGAALRYTAAIFGAGEPQLLADCPEQRRRRIHIDRMLLAIDAQVNHENSQGSDETYDVIHTIPYISWGQALSETDYTSL